MIIHELKIEQKYLVRIVQGDKLFEVRKNDRNYQVNDVICFLPIESDLVNVYQYSKVIPTYVITSIHYGYGIQDEFVVLGIKPNTAPNKGMV